MEIQRLRFDLRETENANDGLRDQIHNLNGQLARQDNDHRQQIELLQQQIDAQKQQIDAQKLDAQKQQIDAQKLDAQKQQIDKLKTQIRRVG